MSSTNHLTGLFIKETNYIELCQKYHIPESLLQEMIEEGLFNSSETQLDNMLFDQKAIVRIETALRLHRDLRINLPGAVLAIELLEEMEVLQKELDILRKHF